MGIGTRRARDLTTMGAVTLDVQSERNPDIDMLRQRNEGVRAHSGGRIRLDNERGRFNDRERQGRAASMRCVRATGGLGRIVSMGDGRRSDYRGHGGTASQRVRRRSQDASNEACFISNDADGAFVSM